MKKIATRQITPTTTPTHPNQRGSRPVFRATAEVAQWLVKLKADILCCHGYKPDLIGLAAARRVGIPVVSISRGWTGATWKVRLNEALDRVSLFGM